MSEYQYYEFRAVDRPLSADEQRQIRELSSRATISATRFVNVYHYGDFRGDPTQVLLQYYDAFLYEANWGTHELMFRFPGSVVDPRMISQYVVEDGLQVTVRDKYMAVDFLSQDEEGYGWIEEEDSEAWLERLLPLRDEILEGDVRALYLGWLAGVQVGMLEDDVIEPPVPPGLRSLSPADEALVEFLRIDKDLIDVAALTSPTRRETRTGAADLKRWVLKLSEGERTDLLLRFLQSDEPHLRAELLRRFREATRPRGMPVTPETNRRTVGALLAAADTRRTERLRKLAEREARERERREAEAAVARAAYLDGLVGKEEQLWRRIDSLIAMRRPDEYDQAVRYLLDLQELATRNDTFESFEAEVKRLRAQNARKVNLIAKLDAADLPEA